MQVSVLALEPHADDLSLFCAFTAQRLNAHVVTVLTSHTQQRAGVTQPQRQDESECAMRELGLTWQQWPYRDDEPDWDAVEAAMRAIDDRLDPETVLAPAVDFVANGHDAAEIPVTGWGVMQHDMVGKLAVRVFGSRVVHYHAYTRWGGRTRDGVEVVGDTDQVCRKLRALACYRSQIGEPSCRSWFLGELTEYLA
jgi:LmbE family N-acetylglucosaminyl deacetylase